MPVLALGAVDLVALLVALAAVLVLAALWVFFKPLAWVLNKVPIPFVNVGDYVVAFLEQAMVAVVFTYDQLTHAVGHWLYGVVVGLWHLIYKQVEVAAGLAGQLGAVADRLGVLFTQAMAEADRAFWGAVAVAQNLFTTAVQTAEWYVAVAVAEAQALFHTAEVDIAAASATALHEAEWFASVVEGNLEAATATLEGRIAAVESDVISEAVRLFSEAEADARAALDAVVAGLEGGITGLAGELQGVVGQLVVLGTIPGLVAAVQALEAEATTCMEPLCNTVTPNAKQLGQLGNLLTNMEALGLAGVLAALVGEAIADPQAAADQIVGAGGWTTDLTVELVNAIVG